LTESILRAKNLLKHDDDDLADVPAEAIVEGFLNVAQWDPNPS
jgi:hypothetical protein